MKGDTAAGGEIVKHEVVWTRWVRCVGTVTRARVFIPVPASSKTRVPVIMIVADTPTLVEEELLVGVA